MLHRAYVAIEKTRIAVEGSNKSLGRGGQTRGLGGERKKEEHMEHVHPHAGKLEKD